MRVTRLRAHGFKSFVDATDIPVQPGLTGIVGPNGCGKSNLVEALRFVMGESSYKAMRGGGMDDVIFSGAANRPARNMAEVTLVVEREETPGPGLEILEITRRIERELGSTYRINGREVRARDVQLLFADAATGAHSAALVRQGQVAELIAAKPVQRRSVLEDAAGISGLHARRGEAELKLKAAEQNLERLTDVMGELGGRLEALRRQARQAVRYRKLSGEIRKAEAMLAAINWQSVVERVRDAEAALVGAADAYARAVQAQAEAARNEGVAGHALPELRDKAAAAAAALQRLRLAGEAIDREEAALKARRADLAARREQAASDVAHEAASGEEADAALARLDEDEAKIGRDKDEAGRLVADARDAAEKAGAAAAATEAEFSAAAGALAAASAERAARERSLREAQAKLKRLEEERKAVLLQRDRIHAEHGDEDDTTASELSAAEAALAAAEREAQAAETANSNARDTEQRARGPAEAAERNLGALQAEARTLAELLDLEKTKRFPPLMDALEVEPGCEKALVAALGDDLGASLDEEAPAFWGPTGSAESDPTLPDGVEPLAELVRGPETLVRRLKQIGLVTGEPMPSLVASLKPGQRLVTRDGALWRWDGLTARAGSAAAGARRLEQRNRVAALVQELKSARHTADKTQAILQSARQVLVDAQALDADSRKAVREARQAVDRKRAAHAEREKRAGRIAERLSAFAGALARIEADTDASRAEIRTAGDALSGLAETADLQTRRDALQAKLAEDRGKAAEARLAADRAEREESARAERLAALQAERERWTGRAQRAGERTRELKERLAALDAEIAAVSEDPERFEARRRGLMSEIGAAEATAAQASDALAEAETANRHAAAAAREALEALSSARETRAREEERAAAARSRKEDLAAEIAEHFAHPVGELRALAGLEEGEALPAVAAVDSRLGKLKAERERLGGVNLRAEEEARELETRVDAMQAEHRDLEEAIKRLRVGIQNLNREGRERLLTAFEIVNGHFGSLFQHLFGGGTAELTLVDSDDPLEAGLEIVARPPGKRPQTMTLLSGGEQALTALSLIFAVFLTNPSPICVLDEVDAPLDDANVERFCSLLDDMRKRTETRFMVVTHNPISMSRMDRLFGVTMAERGVSQIVSVDLEAAERFREAS